MFTSRLVTRRLVTRRRIRATAATTTTLIGLIVSAVVGTAGAEDPPPASPTASSPRPPPATPGLSGDLGSGGTDPTGTGVVTVPGRGELERQNAAADLGSDGELGPARAARVEVVFNARPDGAGAIAASTPRYVARPGIAPIPSEEALAALRFCESGGNYAAVSAGGYYRGAYQFDYRTWDSVASRWLAHLVGTDPAQAQSADQDLLARALYSERGWAPWPHCGSGR